MRLDANTRTFILKAWADKETRKKVLEVLKNTIEPKYGFLCAMVVTNAIDENVLVITPQQIGYGWPMKKVLWRA